MDIVGDKQYYRIRDVAELVGESQSTLRFWEMEFPEISPRRSPKGVRYYTSKDIEQIKLIQFLLRSKGLKIEAAKEQLLRNRKNISNRIKVLRELEEIRSDLETMLAALKKRR